MNDVSISQQLKDAVQAFADRFGRAPTAAAVAPGRVNLIGEHTDYNQGLVLPIAIDRQTLIVAAANQTRQVNLFSRQLPDEPASFELARSLKRGQPSWSNYVRGVLQGCLERGMDPGGFDAWIDSTVPGGAGLSSSAALEVATATLIEQLCEAVLPVDQKALLCQKAEHVFANMPCGIMDQFISAGGKQGCAMLLDCQTHKLRQVPFKDDRVCILVIDSRVKHALTGSEYPQRRAQCAQAAEHLGVESLREATMAQLLKAKSQLDPMVFKRAYHVIGEIERTRRAAYLLEAGDWSGMGRLMYDSHTAMRDAFEITTPELDLLVSLAQQQGLPGGVYGSRMTGGGFGGCTVSLVQTEKAPQIARQITMAYYQQVGTEPHAFVTQPMAGAHAVAI